MSGQCSFDKVYCLVHTRAIPLWRLQDHILTEQGSVAWAISIVGHEMLWAATAATVPSPLYQGNKERRATYLAKSVRVVDVVLSWMQEIEHNQITQKTKILDPVLADKKTAIFF